MARQAFNNFINHLSHLVIQTKWTANQFIQEIVLCTMDEYNGQYQELSEYISILTQFGYRIKISNIYKNFAELILYYAEGVGSRGTGRVNWRESNIFQVISMRNTRILYDESKISVYYPLIKACTKEQWQSHKGPYTYNISNGITNNIKLAISQVINYFSKQNIELTNNDFDIYVQVTGKRDGTCISHGKTGYATNHVGVAAKIYQDMMKQITNLEPDLFRNKIIHEYANIKNLKFEDVDQEFGNMLWECCGDRNSGISLTAHELTNILPIQFSAKMDLDNCVVGLSSGTIQKELKQFNFLRNPIFEQKIDGDLEQILKDCEEWSATKYPVLLYNELVAESNGIKINDFVDLIIEGTCTLIYFKLKEDIIKKYYSNIRIHMEYLVANIKMKYPDFKLIGKIIWNKSLACKDIMELKLRSYFAQVDYLYRICNNESINLANICHDYLYKNIIGQNKISAQTINEFHNLLKQLSSNMIELVKNNNMPDLVRKSLERCIISEQENWKSVINTKIEEEPRSKKWCNIFKKLLDSTPFLKEDLIILIFRNKEPIQNINDDIIRELVYKNWFKPLDVRNLAHVIVSKDGRKKWLGLPKQATSRITVIRGVKQVPVSLGFLGLTLNMFKDQKEVNKPTSNITDIEPILNCVERRLKEMSKVSVIFMDITGTILRSDNDKIDGVTFGASVRQYLPLTSSCEYFLPYLKDRSIIFGICIGDNITSKDANNLIISKLGIKPEFIMTKYFLKYELIELCEKELRGRGWNARCICIDDKRETGIKNAIHIGIYDGNIGRSMVRKVNAVPLVFFGLPGTGKSTFSQILVGVANNKKILIASQNLDEWNLIKDAEGEYGDPLAFSRYFIKQVSNKPRIMIIDNMNLDLGLDISPYTKNQVILLVPSDFYNGMDKKILSDGKEIQIMFKKLSDYFGSNTDKFIAILEKSIGTRYESGFENTIYSSFTPTKFKDNNQILLKEYLNTINRLSGTDKYNFSAIHLVDMRATSEDQYLMGENIINYVCTDHYAKIKSDIINPIKIRIDAGYMILKYNPSIEDYKNFVTDILQYCNDKIMLCSNNKLKIEIDGKEYNFIRIDKETIPKWMDKYLEDDPYIIFDNDVEKMREILYGENGIRTRIEMDQVFDFFIRNV